MFRQSPEHYFYISILLIYSFTFQIPLIALAGSPHASLRESSLSSHSGYRAERAPVVASSPAEVRPDASSTGNISPLAVGPITATNRDSFADPNLDGKVQQGETITYTVVITNTGTNDALNVAYNDNISVNTSTLVPGSSGISPIIVGDSYSAIGNVKINSANIVGAGHSVLDNDPPSSTVSGVTTANNGTVLMNSDGTFTYNPAAGFSGTDSFFYAVSNSFGPGTAKVTITVSAPIWFVNSGAASNGNGTLSSPFNCLTGAGCFSSINDGAANHAKAGDTIFMYASATTYAGGLTLLNNQKLIGQGASSGTTLAAIAGVTVPPGSDPLPTLNGDPSTLNITTIVASTNGVNLTSNDTFNYTLRGFTIGNTTGFKIASGATLRHSTASLRLPAAQRRAST
ncbi:MAG: hypothetical protein AUG51_04000 [Acidobacteria bacterium 13_1_20CM_3_53_8]|nr:MAG: hypothetical protein AUG51_04000 [Acidobacteria bacterium 13_1_20CM_3_53_8]